MDKYYKVKEIKALLESSHKESFKTKLQILKHKEDISTREKAYLRTTLRDLTGELNINIFPERHGVDIDDLKNYFAIGNILDLTLKIEKTAKGSFVNIERFKTLNPDQFNLEEFIKPMELDKDVLINTLHQRISKIQDKYLKSLLDEIFNDNAVKQKYIEWPSSIKHHHSYRFGNLEHTAGMIKIFDQLLSFYDKNTKLDIELIYTGIILHDIGKILEYKFNNGIPLYSENANLGHLYLGAQLISRFIDKVDGFPTDLKNRLIHLILSHHGKEEWDAVEEPQKREAEFLHYLDMIDSRFKLSY